MNLTVEGVACKARSCKMLGTSNLRGLLSRLTGIPKDDYQSHIIQIRSNKYMYNYTQLYTIIYNYIQLCIYIYVYIYTYIHTYIYICIYIYIHIILYQYVISENAVYRPKDCHPLNGLRLGTSAIASERDIRWKVIRFKRWLVTF